MGLDAFVHCNCFETGNLHLPPPCPKLVYLDNDGSLACKSDDPDIQHEFNQWWWDRHCEHEDGFVMHHYIGSVALVSTLRRELQREASKFPILLEKVLYNGIHAGDSVQRQDLLRLRHELASLAGFRCSASAKEPLVQRFRIQMAELVACALSINKPMTF